MEQSIFQNKVMQVRCDGLKKIRKDMGFTSQTSRAARNKRKRVFTRRTTRSGWQKERDKRKRVREAKEITRKASLAYRKSLSSRGSNGAVRTGRLSCLLDAMNKVKMITRKSHVVDFGSGDGEALAYIAKRYGCMVTGIEYDRCLHEMAVKLFEKEKMTKSELFAKLDSDWLKRIGATHVYTFDGVFEAQHWNTLFYDVISNGPNGLVGASCSKWRRTSVAAWQWCYGRAYCIDKYTCYESLEKSMICVFYL